MVRIRRAGSALPAIGIVLACLCAAAPARAVEAATCRELERKFDLIKADMVAIQLNSQHRRLSLDLSHGFIR